jgi:Fe-S cluster assembly protein SufD
MSLTATENNLSAQIKNSLNAAPKTSALRKDAFDAFASAGLPTTKHEEYKYTPLTRELEKNFSLTPGTIQSDTISVEDFLIPGLQANVLVFINGVFSKENSKTVSPASEFNLSDLISAEASNDVVKNHLGKYASVHSDAFVAWNTAGWKDGLLIHIPDNIEVSHPFVIHHITDSNQDFHSLHRNLFVVGKSSKVTIVEKFDSRGSGKNFLNLVTEIAVEENAAADYYSIQNDNGNRYQFTSTDIYQKRSSRVNTYSFTLDGKIIRTNLQLIMDGEGIESHMYGLYLLKGDTLADNHTVADHRKPNSFSNELYKGVMDGSSRGVFNGKIYVRPQAQKTNAFQANRNILLTDKATVNTKPQLEIWADDVKCSHGCTSGQLDEEALFYLRTRGINKDTAQAMMLYAFAGQVIDQIGNPTLRSYLNDMISERLHKNF